jgi:hypothetical protein
MVYRTFWSKFTEYVLLAVFITGVGTYTLPLAASGVNVNPRLEIEVPKFEILPDKFCSVTFVIVMLFNRRRGAPVVFKEAPDVII